MSIKIDNFHRDPLKLTSKKEQHTCILIDKKGITFIQKAKKLTQIVLPVTTKPSPNN